MSVVGAATGAGKGGWRSLWGGPRAPFLALAAGGLCTLAWVLVADAGQVWAQARSFHWGLAVPAVALTLSNVLLRLLRWQFLLRRAGVWLPMRQSAGIFVAGLAMILTPAYAGEGIKTWLVARTGRQRPPRDGGQAPGGGDAPQDRGGTPVWPRAAGMVVCERLLDAVALALVAGGALLVAGERGGGLVLTLAGLAGVALGALGARSVTARGRRWGRRGGGRGLEPVGRAGVALLLSLLAWLCGCLTLYAVCRGLELSVSPAQAVGTYGAATLLGGLTFLPAGVGVVGTAMLVRLEGYGATLQQAVLAAVLVRLLTVWLTAALGVAGCWRLWRLGRRQAAPGVWTPAGDRRQGGALRRPRRAYAGELSPAARERVVGRKVALTVHALQAVGIAPGARLLDAGCGPGWYVGALAGAGYRVVGVDLAPGQVAPRGGGNDGDGAPRRLCAGPPVPERGLRRRPRRQRPAPRRRPRRPGCGAGRDGPRGAPRGARPGARDLHRQPALPPLHGLPLPPLEAHRPGHRGVARPPPSPHGRRRRPYHPAPLHLPPRLHPRGPLPLPGPPGAVAGALPLGAVRRPLHCRLPAPAGTTRPVSPGEGPTAAGAPESSHVSSRRCPIRRAGLALAVWACSLALYGLYFQGQWVYGERPVIHITGDSPTTS